jgi:hypothetical protein
LILRIKDQVNDLIWRKRDSPAMVAGKLPAIIRNNKRSAARVAQMPHSEMYPGASPILILRRKRKIFPFD